VDDVAHVRAGLPVHQQHACDRRGGGPRIELVEATDVGTERQLLDLEQPDVEAHAAAVGQLAVRDELLEPLVERP
jgi:hypothetical protein